MALSNIEVGKFQIIIDLPVYGRSMKY